ncbi:hypothetical protein BGZ80_006577 [Entomortierella chlamydospora]|uniref:Uncharacterized protein n=1 Tax=Entomortierella chlamydospora TaxID=101097 RepID=A0A9P6MGW7_9FUNG|nr:hypothetical protein BGZ80_006577 [Entomortierella chlamydospora]
MVMIEPRFNTKTGEYIILWNDIKAVLRNAQHVQRGKIAVSFHTDDDFEFIKPLRFSTFSDNVLDVVVDTQEAGIAIESLMMQDPPVYTSGPSPANSNYNEKSKKAQASAASFPENRRDDTQNTKTKGDSHDLDESKRNSTSLGPKSTDQAQKPFSDSNDDSHSPCNQPRPGAKRPSDGFSIDPYDVEDMNEDHIRGLAYYEGENIRQDHVKALVYFLKAAN